MKRLAASVSVLLALVLGSPASATISHDLNLPGIGNQIPVISFSSAAQSLNVTREIDIFSPALLNAVISGTIFPAGSLDTYDSSLSTLIPVTSFVMTNVVITNLSFSPGIPIENVGLSFVTGESVSNSIPEPSSLLLLGAAGVALIGGLRASGNVRAMRTEEAETIALI